MIEGYITGLVRDAHSENKISHLYKGDFENPGLPMCRRGYNRDNGTSYSIFRGNVGKGICKICLRRARAGLDGVEPDKSKYRHFEYSGYEILIEKDFENTTYISVSSINDTDFFNYYELDNTYGMKKAVQYIKNKIDNNEIESDYYKEFKGYDE